VLDGRRLQDMGEIFELNVSGFCLVSGVKSEVNFLDEADVITNGFREVADIVRANIPEARKVFVFDHALRTGGQQLQESPEGTQNYGALVHCDCTCRSGWTRGRDQALGSNEVLDKYGQWPATYEAYREVATRPNMDDLFRAETKDHNSPDGRGGDFMIVNLWRPLDAVENYPLAMCDARSFEQGDLHPTWLRHFGVTSNDGSGIDGSGDGNYRTGEVLTPLHNIEHRWLIFPRMNASECLLLKTFDSRKDEDRARFHCHSAIFDPNGDPKAQRRSVEFRCVVLCHDTDAFDVLSSKI
jgi:hypothetical protein